jgi:hypothetical protein
MPDPSNPYMTVGVPSGPNYAAPLLDWQGMANGMGNALTKTPQQPGQPGQPGAPMNIRSPAQMQGAQPNQQGLGARLMALFGGQQGAPQFGGPQAPVPSAQGPTGVY